jgi:hypothetical protein
LSPESNAGQLLAYCAGGAGSGISFLLEACAMYVQLQYKYRAVNIMAKNNRAANLIHGHTIDSTLHTFVFRSKKATNEQKEDALADIRKRFTSVKVIFIDEISVVNLHEIGFIHAILIAAFPERKHLPFAGFNVVFFGDYYQLPPVTGEVPYKDTLSTDAYAIQGRKLLVEDIQLFFEFTTPNFRQNKDSFYHLCCQTARFAEEPSPEMLQKLNERFCTFARAKVLAQQGAIWAATTHRVKDQLNSQELQENMKSGATVVNVYYPYGQQLHTE